MDTFFHAILTRTSRFFGTVLLVWIGFCAPILSFLLSLSVPPSTVLAVPMVADRTVTVQNVFFLNRTLYQRLHTEAESVGYGRGARFAGIFWKTDINTDISTDIDTNTDVVLRGQRPSQRMFLFRKRPKIGVFADVSWFGQRQKSLGITDFDGFQADTSNLTIGVDRIFSPCFIGGVAFHGAKSEIDSRVTQAENIHIDSSTGSLYGLWGQNDWSFGATTGLTTQRKSRNGWMDDNSSGGTPNLEPVASRCSENVYFISTEFSRKMRLVCGDLTPFYGIDYIYLRSSEEMGYTPFGQQRTIFGSDTHAVLQQVGFRFSRKLMFGNWIFDPEMKLAWLHGYGSKTDTIQWREQSADLIPVTSVHGVDLLIADKDRAFFSACVGARYMIRHQLYAKISAEHGHRYKSHIAAVGYGFTF